MFDAAIWQYFQWIDGKLFSALEADVMPFAIRHKKKSKECRGRRHRNRRRRGEHRSLVRHSKGEKGEIQSGEGTLYISGACGNLDRRNDPWNYSRYDIRVRRTEDEKKNPEKEFLQSFFLL